ncbi:MAG: AIM24 family protein, partial [Thermoplasmata archaeon]
MKYKITGDNLQIVTCELEPNERVYAEAGTMVYMSGNMMFEARAKGGMMKGLKRKLSGE